MAIHRRRGKCGHVVGSALSQQQMMAARRDVNVSGQYPLAILCLLYGKGAGLIEALGETARVNPAGMCWVTRIPGESGGMPANTCGSPRFAPRRGADQDQLSGRQVRRCAAAVDAPSAGGRSAQSGRAQNGAVPVRYEPCARCAPWRERAARILSVISRAYSSMPRWMSSLGLATKSTAPSSSAFIVASAPARSASTPSPPAWAAGASAFEEFRPSMRGISMSSVRTSGEATGHVACHQRIGGGAHGHHVGLRS